MIQPLEERLEGNGRTEFGTMPQSTVNGQRSTIANPPLFPNQVLPNQDSPLNPQVGGALFTADGLLIQPLGSGVDPEKESPELANPSGQIKPYLGNEQTAW